MTCSTVCILHFVVFGVFGVVWFVIVFILNYCFDLLMFYFKLNRGVLNVCVLLLLVCVCVVFVFVCVSLSLYIYICVFSVVYTICRSSHKLINT